MKIGIIGYLLIISLNSYYCITRKLNSTLLFDPENDLCKDKNQTLFQVDAEGSQDTLHYLWSFIEKPSLLVALTPLTSELIINWIYSYDKQFKCLPGSIDFSTDIFYTFGISIQKIFEFNDFNNNGNIDMYNDDDINYFDSRYFQWDLKSIKMKDQQFMEFEMIGHSYNNLETNIHRNGNIRIIISVFGKRDRYYDKPYMLHSENTTQIDLTIENFETNRTFTNSRFGIEILFVADENSNSTFSIQTGTNIDDEHTPGIFKVMQIRSPFENTEFCKNMSMFMRWRPISYTTKDRDVIDSIEIISYDLKKSKTLKQDTLNTILYPYYQEKLEQIIVEKINLTFGLKGDDFYRKTNYTSWTIIVGYNNPIEEGISSLTMFLIFLILTVPTILLVLIALLICYRRRKLRVHQSLINS